MTNDQALNQNADSGKDGGSPSAGTLADRSGTGDSPEDRLQQERHDLAGVVGSPWTRALRLGGLVAVVVLLGVKQGFSMLVVVAAIVIMIFLHELGHFIMARRAGMLVTEFFIGFGPRIFSFRRGANDNGSKVILAGGFVKCTGLVQLGQGFPALSSPNFPRETPSPKPRLTL